MNRFTFRPNTTDYLIYSLVVNNNEYSLPFEFEQTDIIVDVGAHIGSFTYAVLLRGAGKVYAVEADAQNYARAQVHLASFIDSGQVDLQHAAVWRSDQAEAFLYQSAYPPADHGDLLNTGGVQVSTRAGGEAVPTIAFDDLVSQITADGQPIRLLKLDCEGSEWPILLTSEKLDCITEIVGELHPFNPEHLPESSVDFTLEEAGFHVTFKRHQRPAQPDDASSLGMFRAVR